MKKMMDFTSKKYSRDELIKMGVIALRNITCRKVDFNNPHFINYNLYDILSNANGQIRDSDAYIIEGGDHFMNDKLVDIEILYFGTLMHRDKFIFMNHEHFKLTNKEGEIVHEEIALTYLN